MGFNSGFKGLNKVMVDFCGTFLWAQCLPFLYYRRW